MLHDIQETNLLTDLSEQQQETVSGGWGGGWGWGGHGGWGGWRGGGWGWGGRGWGWGGGWGGSFTRTSVGFW